MEDPAQCGGKSEKSPDAFHSSPFVRIRVNLRTYSEINSNSSENVTLLTLVVVS